MSAPSSGPPNIFDASRRVHRLARAQRLFPQADFLHRRAAEDAAHTLSAILREFPRGVDLSPHGGLVAQALQGMPAAERIGAIESLGSLDERAAPGAAPLPVAEQSADLIINLFGLHWANDLPGALAQIRRALRPDGLFIGSLFGAATLKELRGVLTEAELEIRGGAQARISPFVDGFDGAGLLQRAGFALPVSDVDRVTVRYRDPFSLMRDLRAMGETNALAGQIKPLSRDILARAAALYVERHAEADGRIPATFEMVHLAGWAPHESQQKPAKRGSAKMRLADALGVKEVTDE
ncbi:methyltransferase domain-containing protein [Brevundimonas terrae]|uniref:Methyltransferase domain-containing protein n=1 Tax=Brevundimonas terrae TaxID=363631 RepID=A0ABP3HXB9_9CAUL|nr:methyltransferase domain-containing protein [Brevundimonas terrae]NIJ25757.1 SAM-dependent methyltransferase [Brevundimonas terrae]